MESLGCKGFNFFGRCIRNYGRHTIKYQSTRPSPTHFNRGIITRSKCALNRFTTTSSKVFTRRTRSDAFKAHKYSEITPETKALDQIRATLSVPLEEIQNKFSHKSFEYRYTKFNRLEKKEIDTLMTSFKNKLDKEISDFVEQWDQNKERHNFEHTSTSKRAISDMKLVDFINPKLCNISQLIYLIQNNSQPKDILKFYNLNNNFELLSYMLLKLLDKEFVELKIKTTKPESDLIDFSNPSEWFPEARKMKRKIIMHVGPTNSGKTYNSLQTLANAKSGYYAGPLRLLAREIYERFNENGVKCNLITGEEVIPTIDNFGKVSELSSGTIEMIPVHKKMEVCVIDEIQMISDERRGAAWTNALLGVLAEEVHLCGEESAVPLVKRLTKITGDELIIKKYERLGKLTVESKPLTSLKNLKKGDCLIVFSKRKILELKCQIEKTTKFKVGIIYGALPPEIRAKEAQGFNSGDYDILVASDAVGMGLNLKIKRIVFQTIKKFNGSELVSLSTSAVKQIAGRAGRFSQDKGELEGFVTACSLPDLKYIKKEMGAPIRPLKKACLWPTNIIWKHYMTKFPKNTPFFEILNKFAVETSSLNMQNYFISEIDQRNEVLRLFLRENLFKRTSIEDQLVLSLAPVNVAMASEYVVETAFKFIKNITICATNNVFDFKFLHENIIALHRKALAKDDEIVETLQMLEDNHRQVLLFLWLSQRWPTLFVDKESAMDIKSLLEKRISQELINLRRVNQRG